MPLIVAPHPDVRGHVIARESDRDRSALVAGKMPESLEHGPARLCILQRAPPPKRQMEQFVALTGSAYEPGGRGFDFCRARQIIKGLQQCNPFLFGSG